MHVYIMPFLRSLDTAHPRPQGDIGDILASLALLSARPDSDIQVRPQIETELKVW